MSETAILSVFPMEPSKQSRGGKHRFGEQMDAIIDPKHPLVRLAVLVSWSISTNPSVGSTIRSACWRRNQAGPVRLHRRILKSTAAPRHPRLPHPPNMKSFTPREPVSIFPGEGQAWQKRSPRTPWRLDQCAVGRLRPQPTPHPQHPGASFRPDPGDPPRARRKIDTWPRLTGIQKSIA